jgi:hypothetical protein
MGNKRVIVAVLPTDGCDANGVPSTLIKPGEAETIAGQAPGATF